MTISKTSKKTGESASAVPSQAPAAKKRKRSPDSRKSSASCFERVIDRFVMQVDSMARALDPTMSTMAKALKHAAANLDKFVETRGVRKVDQKGKEGYRIKAKDSEAFVKHHKELISASLAIVHIPRIFLCALVHQYDAYLGRLLRAAFLAKPEIINSSQKNLTFAELVQFPSLEGARESIIEKELDAVLRENVVSQFEWMESRFGLPLRKDLPSWSAFVELNERRNLFVHCDGVVSSQYLSVCQKHAVAHQQPVNLGDELHVDEKYFTCSFDCILEIGIKLGHVLWRKLKPDELDKADEALHLVTYELLCRERYPLVIDLLTFAVDTLKKQSSDKLRRVNLVNLALAHYLSGDRAKCNEILNSHDWSACSEDFALAVAVLHEKYDDAAAIMRKIGRKGTVSQEDYSTWPLFRKFRETKPFKATYSRLFGVDFVLSESSDLEERVKARRQKNEPTRPSRLSKTRGGFSQAEA